MKQVIELENHYSPHYYHQIPVVLVKGKGVHVWDIEGKKYIDFMSAYSAVSHGHCHPRLVKKLQQQAEKLNVVSRAYFTDALGPFLKKACTLMGYEKAIPMNSGAEAVETAIKAARKWGYEVKNIPDNQAEIIVCNNNFHGRTTTIVSFSSEPGYKHHFGPCTPGFKLIPFGDADALNAAITPNTAAFLVEPIQGEAGILIPPEGYLKRCEEICKKNNVLLIADEIQTGLGRTGKLIACHHENVQPDGLILGKALGGGMLPVSLFLANDNILGLFNPGDHGSTFGGNQLSSVIGLEALNILEEENLVERSETLGNHLMERLSKLNNPLITSIRGRGLFVGLEINSDIATGREVAMALMKNGLLSKETHATVVRLAPPLVITKEELDSAIEIIFDTINSFTH